MPVPAEVQPPCPLTFESTEIEVRRYTAQSFPNVLRLIRARNRKPVQVPPPAEGGTALLELMHFRTLADLSVDAAYTLFADGAQKEGTEALLEALVMSHQVQGATIMHVLVGLASQATVLAAFDRHLPSLTLEDCREVEAVTSELLVRPPGILAALHGERAYMQANTEATLAGREQPEDEDLEGVSEWVGRLTPEQRGEASRAVSRHLDGIFGPWISRLDGPESGWYEESEASDQWTSDAPDQVESLQDFLRLADSVRP